MKAIRYWAIAGLFAPLGLVITSCYQDPVETTVPEESQDVAESEDLGEDEAELTEADPQAAPVDPVCRPRGFDCHSDWQCCSGECSHGECRGGGGHCRPRGDSCH